MPRFRRPSIAAPLLVPVLVALAGCGAPAPAEKPPLTQAALAAVKEDAGAPRDQLARKIDDLFADPAAMGETRALLVMHGGRVVAERYAPGYGPDTRFISWSMAKTITAVMIGMLVADGRLRLDESPPIPLWQRPGDPRGEIMLRQLLQMRSGLRHTEGGDPPYESSEAVMLFLAGRDDMARFAEEQPLEAEPGAKFEYSSATTVILSDIAARVLTHGDGAEARRRAVDEFLKARIFAPLAMESMVPEYDAAGTQIGGSLIHGTARDWARFGDFLRNKGSYRGSQLVPRQWVEFMTRPSPRAADYGAQTWLNRRSEARGDDQVLFPGRGPASLFSLVGHMGQYVIVSPDQQLTVVRLGHSDDAQRAALMPALAEIVELYPAR
ncbi:MAG: serine hydrolase [Citromicrobium sp.]|nr:MAG: serine hydrolase [Citromicrobium sp.]